MPATSPIRGRRRIVLYFPRYAPKSGEAPRPVHLPLSLLTLAGLPLREGFDVVLIDGNLHEPEAAHRLVDEACRGALIFGTTGIVGHQVADAHLCCGSAGTYSVLQPQLSGQLLDNKLNALQQDTPDVIATANIGCQLHLASRARRPVKHWIELLHERLG